MFRHDSQPGDPVAFHQPDPPSSTAGSEDRDYSLKKFLGTPKHHARGPDGPAKEPLFSAPGSIRQACHPVESSDYGYPLLHIPESLASSDRDDDDADENFYSAEESVSTPVARANDSEKRTVASGSLSGFRYRPSNNSPPPPFIVSLDPKSKPPLKKSKSNRRSPQAKFRHNEIAWTQSRTSPKSPKLRHENSQQTRIKSEKKLKSPRRSFRWDQPDEGVEIGDDDAKHWRTWAYYEVPPPSDLSMQPTLENTPCTPKDKPTGVKAEFAASKTSGKAKGKHRGRRNQSGMTLSETTLSPRCQNNFAQHFKARQEARTYEESKEPERKIATEDTVAPDDEAEVGKLRLSFENGLDDTGSSQSPSWNIKETKWEHDSPGLKPGFPSTESETDNDQYSITESLEIELSQLDLTGTKNASGPANSRNAPREFRTFCFSLQYEVFRVALANGVSLDEFDSEVLAIIEPLADSLHDASTKTQMWDVLQKFSGQISGRKNMPQPSCDNIWQRVMKTKVWPNEIELSGTASPVRGPELDFDINLNPLKIMTRLNRFVARFGSDRFLTLKLPYDVQKNSKYSREQVVDWLVCKELKILNRTWKCFSVQTDFKDGSTKHKKTDWSAGESFLIAHFFAERGVGLGDTRNQVVESLGFQENERICRDEKTRDGLIEWNVPIEKLKDKQFSKTWSRINLGLSSSTPTVTFDLHKVRFVEDIVSLNGQVMNDGSSVCSPKVMRLIREKLNLSETPVAVQGRLGGAKGVWFIDPSADIHSEEVSIEITESQLKYEFHNDDTDPETLDWARYTLFVVNYSKELGPGTLNIQFVPILEMQHVPFEVFKSLLEEHLEAETQQLLDAATNKVALRQWLTSHGVGDRCAKSGEIPSFDSGTPCSSEEQIAMLLDAGFDPIECGFLMDKMMSIVGRQWEKLLEKLHVRIPASTVAYCVADPTGTLEEGQVSLQFSKGFLDPVTKMRYECVEGDVLVARNPAHLPTDIRKVKAVSPRDPGLKRLKDVIVFSTKGATPLADMLSGGDYDGDKPWVCWDKRLVEPFRNDDRFDEFRNWDQNQYFEPIDPEKRTLQDLHPDVTSGEFFEQFFRRGFTAALQENMIGLCTRMLEKHANNRRNTRFIDDESVLFANLCSVFVDAPKQGIRPTQKTIDLIRQRVGRQGGWLAYKTPFSQEGSGYPEGNPESWFILDRLVLDVGKRKVNEKKLQFMQVKNGKTRYPDQQVSKLYRELDDESDAGNQPLRRVMTQLGRDLLQVRQSWNEATMQKHRADRFFDRIAPVYYQYSAIQPARAERENVDCRIKTWYNNGNGNGQETSAAPLCLEWRLLKASKLFSMECTEKSFVWWMAMPEICYLKAMAKYDGSCARLPRLVCAEMYYVLKPRMGNVLDCGGEEGEEEVVVVPK